MIRNVHRLYNSFVVAACLIVTPLPAIAAVFISEVAWMGSTESANHEWIELTNNGPAVAVDGWVLSDLQNLKIELAGTIPANTAVVLERSSDNSAPGPAFLVYTGALVNTGTDLLLTNSNGQLVERVAGGENWQSIGGDNVTKETAQYSTQGWYTAKATPGVFANAYQAAPAPEPEPESDREDQSTNTNTKKNSSRPETVPLTLPDITLQLAIEAQEIGYVNQAIAFSATASGIGQHLENSLVYQWNFGDGFTAVGEEPEHIYSYAGTYVVTLKAQYKRQTQITRHEITILPVKVSLTQNKHGDVQVHNDTQYELDISGYTVSGSKQFVFPPYSVVLPSQTVTIPRQHLKEHFDPLVAVYDTTGLLLASTFARPLAVATSYTPALASAVVPKRLPTISTQTAPNPSTRLTNTPPPISEVSPADSISVESPPAFGTPLEPISAPAEAPAELPRNERLVYVALAVLILLGILGVYLSPSRRTETDNLQ